LGDVFQQQRQMIDGQAGGLRGVHLAQLRQSRSVGHGGPVQRGGARLGGRCGRPGGRGHPRRFGRDILVCDPWHYLPILERKPGAPFREWDLPVAIQTVRDRILKQPRGDRGFVEMLLMAREVGLEPLQVACELVLEGQVVTAAVVLNEMRRLLAPAHPARLAVPDMLQLQTQPLADCSRYDHLRGASHVIH